MGSDESSTDYEKFIGETEIIELIDNSEIILGSGYTYSGLPYANSATTVANAYSALTKEVIDNEKVVAIALNDLNGRVIELSGNTGGAETDPIFSSSVAAGIKQTDIDKWNAAAGGATITDNSYKLVCNTSTYNTSSPQTITYEIEAGEHSVYIKYSKDDATSENNDTLQFKVTSIETLEPTVGYYTYDLNNISQSHSLIFIFGDVTYYFVTSNTNTDAKLYPSGQMVALPGDNYRLTIVPENTTDTVSLTDNGTDVTGNLERKEVQTEKEGQVITTVNYIYRLTNIQAAHTLNVLSSGGQILSVMSGGTWVLATKVFKRDERGWNEVNNYENLFDSGKIYIPKQG